LQRRRYPVRCNRNLNLTQLTLILPLVTLATAKGFFCFCLLLDGIGGSPLVPQKAPSLRGVKGWSSAQLTQTLRTGIDPTGHQLSDVMPKTSGNMDDDELGALYAYLESLPTVTN
jgi:hypothetical protein